jgi:hypothetical protein
MIVRGEVIIEALRRTHTCMTVKGSRGIDATVVVVVFAPAYILRSALFAGAVSAFFPTFAGRAEPLKFMLGALHFCRQTRVRQNLNANLPALHDPPFCATMTIGVVILAVWANGRGPLMDVKVGL